MGLTRELSLLPGGQSDLVKTPEVWCCAADSSCNTYQVRASSSVTTVFLAAPPRSQVTLC